MKHLAFFLLISILLGACGESYEERRRQQLVENRRLASEDSAALKVAVMPTLDCLPIFIAEERGLFRALGADIRLKRFNAQMDCDTAIARRRVEVMASDLVRTERLISQGTPLDYLAATNAHWTLIANRNARIRQLPQLDDRMVAMTRFSATALLCSIVQDSAKLKEERFFRVQINDVGIRLRMLENNEMDALTLTEPQATAALLGKHTPLIDTRRLDLCLGVIAFRSELSADTSRARQLDAFTKAYNMACDSINKNGLSPYRQLIERNCSVRGEAVDTIAKRKIAFARAAKPREKDIQAARLWLNKQDNTH